MNRVTFSKPNLIHLRDARIAQAKEAREQKRCFEVKQKYAMSLKWNLYRQKKDELEGARSRQIERNHRASILVRVMKYHLAIGGVEKKVRELIVSKIREMKTFWTVTVLKIKFKIKLRKFAPTTELRNLRTMREAVMMFGTTQKETNTDRAKVILAEFCCKLDFTMDNLDKVRDTFFQIVRI